MITTRQEYLLDNDLALDVEVIGVPIDTVVWELYGFLDGKEYIFGSTGEYVRSIAMTEDGRYFAALDYRFRYMSDVTCIWYR